MSPAQAPPEKIGKYEVLETIGRGGMGVVYKARDPIIDRIVAVKTIVLAEEHSDDDHFGRLRQEARSAGKLQHPNIVTIYDFGEEEHMSYIVMEFVEGVNLSRVMHQQRPLPLATRIHVLIQVARGLAYAHECGVIHRDMKPSNVCVTVRGVAKILDFGLARFDSTRLTKTGFLSGTIAYMSPERFRGDSGPADDIFGLGAVAYEFLTYRRAFPGETTPEVVGKILGNVAPAPISTVTPYPKALDDVIARALQPNPADRYTSAADLERALVEFSESAICRRFAIDEMALPEFQTAIRWTDTGSRSSLNPYSASSRSLSAVAVGDVPTVQVPSSDDAEATAVTSSAVEATVVTTKPAAQAVWSRTTVPVAESNQGEATLVLSPPPAEVTPAAPRSRRGALAVASVALLVVVIATVMALNRSSDQATTVQPPQAAKVAPPAEPAKVASESEVEIATTSTVAQAFSQRAVAPEDRVRLASVERERRPERAPAAKPVRERKETAPPVIAAAASVPRSEPATVEPVATVPRPADPAPPVAERVSAAPSPAQLEGEIRAFVRDIAAAYQEKDVAFFRRRRANFDEQMARAISNSPSVRVEISVNSIRLDGADTAVVTVRRVDTFAEATAPPGVQNLVYELRRGDEGWKLVTVRR